jgi:hypothetical protein
VSRLASLRGAMALLAVVAFAAAAAGIGSRASYGAQTTADEPHYLLTALSLARDGDLDVRDELADGAYRPFHEIDLAPQARPLDDGRLIEPHDPLLPALLAAPAALGGWVAAKLTLAAIAAALAALTLWTAVRRFGVPLLPAAAVVGVFAASAPLAAYGAQVYPELPAALAVAVAIAALAGPLRRGGLAALGLAVVALPWLSVKYAPVAAVLALLGLWMLVRAGRTGAALALGGGLAAAALAFLGAHEALYGGLTPYAAGSHFVEGELSVVGSDPDYVGRGRRLVGLLVDRDFGIAAWQPAWLLVVPALACLLARRPRGWAALALPLATGWLVATFVALTMQGWWLPGRQVVAALPAAVLAIAWWARGGGRRLGATLAVGAAGILAYGWVAAEGALGRIAWVVDLQDTANPLYRAWSAALPDYLDVTAATWALHWGWAAALAALAVLAIRSEGFRRLDLRVRSAGLDRLARSGPGAHAAVHDVDDVDRARPHEQARPDAAPLA